MNIPSDEKPDNIVDMSIHRKRRQTLKRMPRQGATSGQQKKKPNPTARKIGAVVQLGVFLALVAYFLKKCSH